MRIRPSKVTLAGTLSRIVSLVVESLAVCKDKRTCIDTFNNVNFKSIVPYANLRPRFPFQQFKNREEGAEHGRTEQPSRGHESWFHPAQQQRATELR
ncbi:hypothetical protein HZH66_001382 [Vespula vulgaris]|uniref:Uncharacterized protein n=1 Tax=Vespula vulgaris TaxID=7454 RepID=A0A834KYL1_VESVU|nr:hypothetical protein HZH66_001382 [Vespula vulgaris]